MPEDILFVLTENQILLYENSIFLNEAKTSWHDKYINLSTTEVSIAKKRFADKGGKLHCGFKKTKTGKYFCYTHRARCKEYDSIEAIPKKTYDFICSTG